MYVKMGLHSVENVKDLTIFNHVQNVAPVIQEAELLRQSTDNGWTESRNMQLIGEIPDIVFFNHPEFYNDDKALRSWLNTDEGQAYRVGHTRHRHETAGIRVK